MSSLSFTPQRLGSLPTKLLLTILTLLLVLVGIFYFLNKTPQTAEAWYSSSWEHRRPISVSNSSGGNLTNTDVLITLDTASLISAGKMQSDCDDLRLVDSDDTTLLSYWIEAGCNTSTTQIWARIPSLLSVGETIFAYYKNSGATNGEAAWSGNFTLMADTTCPAGWTRNSTFDGRFIYGSSTYGSIGSSSRNHNHGGSFNITSNGTTGNWGTGGDCCEYFNWPTHTHSVSGTIGYYDSTPSYRTTILCYASKPQNLGNLIMLSDSTTPSGWTRDANFDGRFPYGSSTYGTAGGVDSHNHSYSVSSVGAASSYDDGVSEPSPNHFPAAKWNHVHTFSVTSNSSVANLPPYKTLLFVKAPASTPNLNYQLIAMANAVPPLGWTRYTALDSYFVRGGSSVNLTAQGSSSHSHSVGFTSGTPNAATNLNYSSMVISRNDHTHTATHYASSFSNIPQYTTTIYVKRNSSQTTTLIGEEMYNQLPSATNLKTENATNPSGVTDTTPEFQATFTDPDGADTGVYYQIQVNTTSAFNGTSMWDSTKTAMGPIGNGSTTPQISYAGTALSLNGTTYYWRMKVWDQATGESAWSSTAQFTMNAAPSTPSTPYCEGATNPSSVTDATPEFSAIHSDPDSNAANYYQIQVNTNNTFTGTVMWDSTKTSIANITSGTRSPDISYAGSSLSFTGVTYYWRIKFWDTNNLESPWSAVQQFTTATPSAFSAPINCLIQKSNVNDYLNVVWSDTASNEDGFQIQRSLNGGAWTTLSGSLAANTTSYLDNSVSSGNTYQYQVRSYFPGPIYSSWCVTPILNLFTTDHTGGFRIY